MDVYESKVIKAHISNTSVIPAAPGDLTSCEVNRSLLNIIYKMMSGVPQLSPNILITLLLCMSFMRHLKGNRTCGRGRTRVQITRYVIYVWWKLQNNTHNFIIDVQFNANNDRFASQDNMLPSSGEKCGIFRFDPIGYHHLSHEKFGIWWKNKPQVHEQPRDNRS